MFLVNDAGSTYTTSALSLFSDDSVDLQRKSRLKTADGQNENTWFDIECLSHNYESS